MTRFSMLVLLALWVNALECAHAAGDAELERRLISAFEPAYGEKNGWMNDYRHVDLSIVGAIPLEIAILTGDERAKKLGLRYADRQWEEPREGLDWGDRWYDKIPLPRPDGLFNHAPQAPFVWGRGTGWLAAAMAMNLKYLPADSEWRAPILAGYRRMMSARSGVRAFRVVAHEVGIMEA